MKAWIEDGEKYAVIGLQVRVEGDVPSGPIGPGTQVLSDTAFEIPQHWRVWLGTIRADEVKGCNLFLLSKAPASAPSVLDEENQRLQQNVYEFYFGLLLASRFAPACNPILLTGSRSGGEIDVRQQQDIEAPVPQISRPYPPILPDEITLAAKLGIQRGKLSAAGISGGYWRLAQTMRIYVEARPTRDILDRLHQYCRCIDGLILPRPGDTKKQFKSRTEHFIGPHHHVLMGEIYDLRSAVEHLHENKYLESFDRDIRLEIVKKEAIIEYIARTCIAHVLAEPALWRYFANATALAEFWALPASTRQEIWGKPFDALAALADFDPKYIHDGHLM
jgi:hypothetical protein